MNKNNYCIIMAGGIGSRFWPVSKTECPKQFLDILGTGKSFIRSTFERFLPVVPPQNFLVVTNAIYKKLVLEHLPELADEQVLCEPMRRNTAPCIAYASYRILARTAKANIVVTPADHLVTNESEFQRIIDTGFHFVSQPENADALLTIGIKPSRPETGYGYIQTPDADCTNGHVAKVASFTEKPDLEKAKQFLESGRYLWNSGIFIWSLQGILGALDTHIPQITAIFDSGKACFGTDKEQYFINQNFGSCPDISIDYGVMEKSPKTDTIPADFGWSDIGTWGSLFVHANKDSDNNAVKGNALLVNTANSVVNVEDGVEAIVQGLDKCLVAFSGKSLIVCNLADEQKIKEWVARLNSTKN
ncbi:MAG: mannose-1-phosphate guanylyltransferase [Bacteroidales bacterium]|nr:mannose-1-phosphate guanylyltransferase [Bacteroidales bacterium]